MPSRPVRVVTQGPSEPVRVVTHGPADPVRIVSSTPSDPVRVVVDGISTPVRIVAGSILSLPDVASATRILDLQADALALSDGDPVGVWPDASGQGHDFTQTGNARPMYKASGGSPTNLGNHPSVQLDGVDDFLDGGSGTWCDNLDSFTVFMVTGFNVETLAKMDNTSTGAGWTFYHGGFSFILQEDGGANWTQFDVDTMEPPQELLGPNMVVGEVLDKNTINIRLNRAEAPLLYLSSPPVVNYSSSDHILIGKLTGGNGLDSIQQFCAIMIYSPAPNASDRDAIEEWLVAKYGIAL